MKPAPSLEDIEKYSEKHGPVRTGKLLSALGKDDQFITAWETPAGKEIMGYLLILTEEGLDKIINEKADERVRAEYRVCMNLLTYFKDRINRYQKNTEQLTRG